MKNWTDDIRQRLQGHRQAPPQELLGNIKAELQRRGLTPTRSSQTTHVGTGKLWWAAACLTAVIAGVGVWWLRHSEPTSIPLTAQKQAVTDQPTQVLEQAADLRQQNLRQRLAIWAGKEPIRPIAARNVQEVKAASAVNSVPAEPSSVASTTETTVQPPEQRPARPARRPTNGPANIPSHPASRLALRLSWSAYTEGTGLSNSGGNGLHGNERLLNVMLREPNGEKPIAAPGYHALQYHHRQPVKVGLSVGYRMGERWSVHTGLTYSYMSAEVNLTGSESENGLQRLHYVGIPLAVSYGLWQHKQLRVYAMAGGEVEKLVNGQLKFTQVSAQEQQHSETISLKEHRLQWSVNAAVGLEYRLTKQLHLYAEPGMSHYFNNGSDLQNSYKDKPTGFQLQIGVRIK